MLFYDGIGRGQSEAGAFFLRGEVGVEDFAQMLGLDADAVVFDRDAAVAAGRQRDRSVGLQGQVVGRDTDDPAVGHGLDGVDDKVLDHLAELALIHLNRPKVRRGMKLAADVGPAESEARRIANQLRERSSLTDGSAPLAKVSSCVARSFARIAAFSASSSRANCFSPAGKTAGRRKCCR